MVSGALLREARQRAGLSQAALAQRAGKATSVIGRWERGEVEPSLERLRALIGACGLELGFSLRPADDEQIASIRLALEQTPEQRLDQLSAWVDFVAEARAGLRL